MLQGKGPIFSSNLTKELCSMGSKCLTLGAGNNLTKRHGGLSIESHSGIFCVSNDKPKYDTQLCVKVKTHCHHMNNLKLDYSIFFT
jgi:hypothetical protein